MSIYQYCEKCRSSSKRGEKICLNVSKDKTICQTPFGNNKRYRVVVRYEGQRLAALFPNLAQAQKGESDLLQELKQRIEAEKQPEILTLNHVWKQYLPFAMENKKSWQDDKWNYNRHIQPRFGDKALEAILPLDIERMKSELKKSTHTNGKAYAAQTIKHQIVILRRLFNFACKMGLSQVSNPVSMVTMPKIDNMKNEFLTEHELTRLLEVLNAWPFIETASLIKFAMLTGWRRSELFKLRWESVDFERSFITIKDPKGTKSETLPVSPEALEVLRQLPVTGELVFPGPSGKIRTSIRDTWSAIKKHAGLPPDFRFHGLRHSWASWMISNGADLAVVQKLMTHKHAVTTQRYSHVMPGTLRDAAVMSGKLLSPKSAEKVRKLPR